MNLAIRGIDGQIAHGDTFHNDRHPDLKADFILANPQFNDSDWRGELLREDKRWQYGAPPVGNANYAWVQHIVHHLAPAGVAGFVLANGSMSSNQSGEGEIRKQLVEANLVDCMVALPGQLFYSTQIPACLWFLARDRKNGKFRDRRGQVLFIDARKLGRMVDRTHRELTDKDVARIANTYHAWRGEKAAGKYDDVPGFCKSAALEEVRKHGHVLTPGRYVGAEAQEDNGEPFEEKMRRLVATLREQQAEGAKLDAAIAANLRELGYGGLPKPLADLFPARLVDSELGEIPERWGVARLGDLSDIDKGLSYKGEGLVDEGGLPMVNLGCFAGHGVFKTENIKRYSGEYRDRHLVRAGDLVIANTDMTQNRVILGSPALLPELNGERRFLFTHHTFAFRFRTGAERWRRYVYFTLLQPEFREIAEGFATGTTVLALPRESLSEYSVVLPPEPVRVAFEGHVEALLASMELARQQSRTLAALRDALLPKLISGELRVTDAARVAARAL